MKNKRYKVYSRGKWKNIYRFKTSVGTRYYKVIDGDMKKKQFLIKEVKKKWWFYREAHSPAFWVDEKIFFKKYERD